MLSEPQLRTFAASVSRVQRAPIHGYQTSVINAATQDERFSILSGNRLARRMPRDATVNGSRSDKEIGAVPWLGGRCSDRLAARDALVRRKLRALLHVFHQQVKGVLRMRLD
jgi:hypothetical protein